MSDGENISETQEPPKDAAAWRELLATLPPTVVLKVLQEEKGRAERIFAGFRPNAGGIHLPLVRDRLIKEAQKQPKLASALAALTPRETKAERPKEVIKPPTALPHPAEETDANAALRAKIEKHRAALREQEAQIHALTVRLAAAEQDAQRAKNEAEIARAAERSASERADRLQRLKERDERRPVIAPAPKEKMTVLRAAIPAPAPPPPLFEETMQRILEVGKPSLVADLCRYALRTDSAADNSGLRGRIHAYLADALNRNNDTTGAAEQGRQAVIALLDGGDALGAAFALARVAERVDTLRKEDAVQISRLLKLASVTGVADGVRDAFLRLALSSATAFRRLRAILPPAEAAKLKEAASAETTRFFGPDEMLNLPGVSVALTPRRIADAINSGDETLVGQIRAGIAAWRDRTGESYAEALLTAIERLSSSAIYPLRHEPNGPIVVDASNVARQTPDPLALDKTGRVANLTSLRDYLLSEGYFPVILIADANLGYQIDDPAAYLSLIDRHILLEVQSGGAADEALIREARQRNAPLVTNDRLRDWKNIASDVRRIPFLILPGQILLEPTRRMTE